MMQALCRLGLLETESQKGLFFLDAFHDSNLFIIYLMNDTNQAGVPFAKASANLSKLGPPLPKHLTIIQAFKPHNTIKDQTKQQAIPTVPKKTNTALPTVTISLATPSKPSLRVHSPKVSVERPPRNQSFQVKNPKVDAQSTLQRWIDQEWLRSPLEYLAIKSMQFRKYKSNIYILQRAALRIQHWYFQYKAIRQRQEQILAVNNNLSTTLSYQSKVRLLDEQYQIPMTIQEKELDSIRKLVQKRVGDYSPTLDVVKTPDRSMLRALKNSTSRNKLESSACILKGKDDFSDKEAGIKFNEDASIIKPSQASFNLSLNPTLMHLQNALDSTEIGTKDRLSLNSNRSYRNSKSVVTPIGKINCIAESYEEASYFQGQHIKITNSQLSFKSNNPALNKFVSQKSSIVEVSDFSKDNVSLISQQRRPLKPSKEISDSLGGNERTQKIFEGHKREREFMTKKLRESEDSYFMQDNIKSQSLQIQGFKLAQETQAPKAHEILDKLRQNKIQCQDQTLKRQDRANSHSVEGMRRHLRSNAFIGGNLPAAGNIREREKSQDLKQPQVMISSVYTAQVQKLQKPESPARQLLTYQNSAKNSFGYSSGRMSQHLSRGSSLEKKHTSQEFSLPADIPQPIFIMRQSTASQPELPLEKVPQPSVIFESSESIIEASQMFDYNGPPNIDTPVTSLMGRLLQPLRKNKSLGSLNPVKRASIQQPNSKMRQSKEIKMTGDRIQQDQPNIKTERNKPGQNSDLRMAINEIKHSIGFAGSIKSQNPDKAPQPRKKSPLPSNPILKPIKTISPIHTERNSSPLKQDTFKTSIGQSLGQYKQQKKDVFVNQRTSNVSPDLYFHHTTQSFTVGHTQQPDGQLYSVDSFSVSGEQALNKASFLSRFSNVAKTLINGHSPGNRSQISISPSPTPRVKPNITQKPSDKGKKQMVEYKQLERPTQVLKKQQQSDKAKKQVHELKFIKQKESLPIAVIKDTPNFPDQRSRQVQHTSVYHILKKNKSFDRYEPLNLQSSLNTKRLQEYDILKSISSQPQKPELIQKSQVESERKQLKQTLDVTKLTYEEFKVIEFQKSLKQGYKKALEEKKRAKSGQDFSGIKKTGYIKSILTKYVQEGSGSNRASIDAITPAKHHKEQIPQALSSGIKHNFHQPNSSSLGGIGFGSKLLNALHSEKSTLFTLNDSGYHKRQHSSIQGQSIHHSPEFADRTSFLQSTDSARAKRRERILPQMKSLGDLEQSQERQKKLQEAMQKSVVMNVNSLSS